jgi:hypothetical protein
MKYALALLALTAISSLSTTASADECCQPACVCHCELVPVTTYRRVCYLDRCGCRHYRCVAETTYVVRECCECMHHMSPHRHAVKVQRNCRR